MSPEDGDGVAWFRLTDIVRATLVFNDLDSMYDALENILTDLQDDAELKVEEVNDRYQDSESA